MNTYCIFYRKEYRQCARCSVAAKFIRTNPCGFCAQEQQNGVILDIPSKYWKQKEKKTYQYLDGAPPAIPPPTNLNTIPVPPPPALPQVQPPAPQLNHNQDQGPQNTAGLVTQAAYAFKQDATDTRLNRKVTYVTPNNAQMTANLQAALDKRQVKKLPKRQTYLVPGNVVTAPTLVKQTFLLGIRNVQVLMSNSSVKKVSCYDSS